jgi:spermidine synthase
MRWYYGFFFVSGFCGILYELVWLRLAMAHFGVTTSLVSIVLSLFMAGLGLGSWAAGRAVRKYGSRLRFPRLALYAFTESLIGVSAIVVPHELRYGRELLITLGNRISLSSTDYYLLSGMWLLLTLVPWCACMGATFPFAMFALRGQVEGESRRSFSYLYLANVLGALAGAALPLLLIERFGFSGSLRVGAVLNLSIAGVAGALSILAGQSRQSSVAEQVGIASGRASARTRWLLFATGLSSMGMEVVWIRMFTPYQGTMVYSFVAILSLYLMATFLGTRIYRRRSSQQNLDDGPIWLMLAIGGLLPLLSADPTLHISRFLRLVVGVAPFSMAAGFASPMLVDRESQGDPDRAGSAYAVNVLGCIVGPLVAGFLLLPFIGERLALVVLALPWFLVSFSSTVSRVAGDGTIARRRRIVLAGAAAVAGCILYLTTRGFEDQFPHARVLRDHTATVIAAGAGMEKRLLVNGVGITNLTPITKMMVHLPLAFEDAKPQSVLVICFGMGTSHRSALSWEIRSTAVELVPTVPRLFSYFHADGDELLRSPQSRLIIDDGRRYMERAREQYDVITIDPPPPVQAAGSSLLYSVEFYSLARQRLKPGGILQQWLPGGDDATKAAVARALKQSFPHVRVFRSLELWGVHFLASVQPIPSKSAAELAGRLPARAVRDLLEWGPEARAEQQFDRVLRNEISLDEFIAMAPDTPALQDNRPINEYYLLRRRMQ